MSIVRLKKQEFSRTRAFGVLPGGKRLSGIAHERSATAVSARRH
jgi:hypothetical protein